MVKVYAGALVVGLVGLLLVVLGGALADNLRRPERDPGSRLGSRGKMAIGAVIGFGMGGLSAEFSPLDLEWPLALALAVVAAVGALVWVRFSVGVAEKR